MLAILAVLEMKNVLGAEFQLLKKKTCLTSKAPD